MISEVETHSPPADTAQDVASASRDAFDVGGGDEESVDAICRRLRAKYQHRHGDEAGANPATGITEAHQCAEKVVRPPTETATVSALATSGSAPRTEVRCCPKCEGQRELREEYNFRLIYRECDFCDGEGTISFDMEGKRILAVRTSVYPQ